MNKKELINYQAQNTWRAIQVGLSNYDIKHGVDYTGISVHNSVMLLTYTLNMINTNKWRTLQGLVPELSQMAQLDKDDRARVTFSGLSYSIEIPKPRQLHDTVNMSDLFNKARGMKVSFGLSTTDNQPNTVDFGPDTAGHMLVSGSTRCGKTNILKIIAMLLMYKNSPDNLRIAVIDTVKADAKYKALKNSAHLATDIIDTEPKAVAFLNWAKNQIINLKGNKFTHKVVIIIDEIFLLLQNKKVAPLLKYIASAGAEVGFHLIPATQYTNVDDIGGTQFKGNLMTRVVGQVINHYASSSATGREGLGAENLMAPGDFLVVDQNGVQRIAVPELHDKFFDKVPRGISPIAKLNWQDDEIDDIPNIRGPNIGTCFDKVDPRLLGLAINGSVKGKPLGADRIRKASYILNSKGLGERIGQNTAQEYVKFADKYRSVNKK